MGWRQGIKVQNFDNFILMLGWKLIIGFSDSFERIRPSGITIKNTEKLKKFQDFIRIRIVTLKWLSRLGLLEWKFAWWNRQWI